MPTSGGTVGEHEITPPDLPANCIYTSCYCEENVYLLCREFLGRKEVCERWEVWAVFISNENKTVSFPLISCIQWFLHFFTLRFKLSCYLVIRVDHQRGISAFGITAYSLDQRGGINIHSPDSADTGP